MRVTIEGLEGAITPKVAQVLADRLLQRGRETNDAACSRLGLTLRNTDTVDPNREEVPLNVGPVDEFRDAVLQEAAAIIPELEGEERQALEDFINANKH